MKKITLLAMILISINAFAILVPQCATIDITEQPGNIATCEGQGTFFSMVANGTGLTYQWQVDQGAGFTNLSNNPPYSSVTSNLLSISFVSQSFNSYQYRCIVTDSCATTSISNAGTLTVSSPPVVTANSATISSGETAILTATGATTYVWHIGGMMGDTTNPISLSPTSTTTYTVTGTTNGCSSTTTATVTVTIQGATGATGATGPTGAIGAVGATGATGADGIQGATGATGAQGVQGNTGATGAAGADGALSAWGKAGTAGTNPATDFLGTTDATALSFRTNNVERIRILPSGSIGVGTATPVAIGKVFQVSSNDASGTSMFLENSVSGGKNWRMLSCATNNTGGAGSFMIVNHTDDSANPKLMITPAGNIGIGTAIPNSIGKTLHIASANTGGTSLFLENTKSWRMLSTGTANTGGGGNLLIVNHSDDAANPKFTISAAGNVGVGTVSPSAKLDVNGNAKIANDLIVGGNFTFGGDKTISYLPASGNNPATLSFGAFPWVLPPNWNPCLTIGMPNNHTINQFTGIIQSYQNSPSGANTGLLAMGFNGTDGTIELAGSGDNPTTNLLINNGCGKDVFICTGQNGGNIQLCATDGQVAIGKNLSQADPLMKLDIAGNVELNNYTLFLRNHHHGLGWFGNDPGANPPVTQPFTTDANENIDGPVLFGYSGGALGTSNNVKTIALRWNSNGKVQIGTQTITSGPHTDYKLSVDGKIVAKEIYVIAPSNGWADYVFASDYKLSSLDEVEKYYKKHKHLSEIPSEKEIIENGINVGEMNKLLLKKIEELTLYLIEQNKRIETLEKN